MKTTSSCSDYHCERYCPLIISVILPNFEMDYKSQVGHKQKIIRPLQNIFFCNEAKKEYNDCVASKFTDLNIAS